MSTLRTFEVRICSLSLLKGTHPEFHHWEHAKVIRGTITTPRNISLQKLSKDH